MNQQLAGLEDLDGTYVFDLHTSNRAMKLNRFLWKMIGADARAEFSNDPEKAMTSAGLSTTEKDLVRRQDWIGLIRAGASFFVLEKFARVAQRTNLEVYAMMRGETFDEFMATRRVPECR
jgi:hypothetical protein